MDQGIKNKIMFLDNGGRRLFVHEHPGSGDNGICYIFLAPLYRERRQVHHLMAEMSRRLCVAQAGVLRFDYYGTGDSGGRSGEFGLEGTLADLDFLWNYVATQYKPRHIVLLGFRTGADLALLFSKTKREQEILLLIDPTMDGKAFIEEQRLRKTFYFKLNKIKMPASHVLVNGERYEDLNGYLVSERTAAYFNNLNIEAYRQSGKTIFLITATTLFSKSNFEKLQQLLSEGNVLETRQLKVNGLWTSVERTDTSPITECILDLHTKLMIAP